MLHPEALPSPILLAGDERHAYRDPAVYYRDGVLHLYATLVETEDDGGVYMYVVHTRTNDLLRFTKPVKLTVRDRAKNFSSPGNIVDLGGRYLMCLQSYCRENGEKYGNDGCRIWFSESRDLIHWDAPYPVCLKGDLPLSAQGRMIDPYLLYDESTGLWNCFFKQNGISRSTSPDLRHWRYEGHCEGGENCCVIRRDGAYYLFHSPKNGIGIRRSADLVHWEDCGVLTLGQEHWPWARGRITAGAVTEIPSADGAPLYLMLFHGTGPEDESVIFDTHACIGIAWSRDLLHWEWHP